MTKQYLLPLLALLSFVPVQASAQPRAAFASARHDFGSLAWNEQGLATFTVQNTGDTPLYIREVKPSCACTAVNWTKEAIPAGKTGTVDVVFHAELLGHFDRYVEVTTSADAQPVFLRLTGDVVREKRAYTGDYPFHVGDIYLSADNVEFDDVNKGDTPSQILTLFNASEHTYSPTLMHLPPWLSVQAVPAQVRSRSEGKLILTLDSRKLHTMGLTKTSIFVSRFAGDKISPESEVSVSAILLPSFDLLTPEQLAAAPVASLSQDTLHIAMPAAGKVKRTLLLTNKGQSPLSVRSLQVFNTALNVSLNKRTLKAGETAKLQITVVEKYLKTKGRKRILLITGDPQKPKQYIDLLIH